MKDTVLVRSASAQADTGQTDIVTVPPWARTATIYLSVTDAAGNTPLTDLKLAYVFPSVAAGTTTVDMQWNGITQIAGTTAGNVVVNIGGLWDTEDDTGPVYFVKDPLPRRFAIITTLDRTTGDETYTYSIHVDFQE